MAKRKTSRTSVAKRPEQHQFFGLQNAKQMLRTLATALDDKKDFTVVLALGKHNGVVSGQLASNLPSPKSDDPPLLYLERQTPAECVIETLSDAIRKRSADDPMDMDLKVRWLRLFRDDWNLTFGERNGNLVIELTVNKSKLRNVPRHCKVTHPLFGLRGRGTCVQREIELANPATEKHVVEFVRWAGLDIDDDWM